MAEIPAAIALGVEDLAAVIALVEEEASAGVIVLAVVAVVALAALAVVADSGADAENLAWNPAFCFLETKSGSKH